MAIPKSNVLPSSDMAANEIVVDSGLPQYAPFPCLRFEDESGTVVARYELTFIERLRVLFGGSIWVRILTFGNKLHPIALEATEPVLTEDEKEPDPDYNPPLAGREL